MCLGVRSFKGEVKILQRSCQKVQQSLRSSAELFRTGNVQDSTCDMKER